MLTYKVVEIKQRTLGKGYLTPFQLEMKINEYANLGWKLDRITSADTQGVLHAKDVFLLIFYRDIILPPALHIKVNDQTMHVTWQSLQQLKWQGAISPQTPATKYGDQSWSTLGNLVPDVCQTLFT